MTEVRPPRARLTHPSVVKARGADVRTLADTCAAAFYEDPVFRWLFPRDRRRLRQARRYFLGRTRMMLRQDEVYTTDDRAAAAMWARPGEWRDPPLPALREMATLAPALGGRILRSLTGLHEIESRHPPHPHWYLSVLATLPDRQGEGLGSALIAPILAGCDRDGVPAYLETATEANVAFYSRHGFRVTGELELPSGPTMWLMWRDPRP